MQPFVIVGAPFENGIAMMQRLRRGVLGAALAPEAIFKLLPEAWPRQMLNLAAYSFRVMPGTVDSPLATLRDNMLTLAGHAVITSCVAGLTDQGQLPITIGGDHSITYPLLRGVARGRPLGVIYIDAHLDMRPLEQHAGVDGLISSGNSFRRILENSACHVAGRNMVAIGVQPSSSAIVQAMRAFAEAHGVSIIWLNDCADNLPAVVEHAVQRALDGTEGVYLSLDIDAVRASDAPGVSAAGVSAPANSGLSRDQWLTLVGGIAAAVSGAVSGAGVPLVGVDLVETSARTLGWERLFANAAPGYAYAPPAVDVLTPTARLAAETLAQVVAQL